MQCSWSIRLFGTMNDILIIGIGNSLRGDDGIAETIVSSLMSASPDADFLVTTQLNYEHAQQMAAYRAIVFIDATVQLEPGKWSMTRLIASRELHSGLTHHVTPGDLLTVCKTLYDASPSCFLLSVGANCFDQPDDLTERVKAVVSNIVQYLIEMLHDSKERFSQNSLGVIQ